MGRLESEEFKCLLEEIHHPVRLVLALEYISGKGLGIRLLEAGVSNSSTLAPRASFAILRASHALSLFFERVTVSGEVERERESK
jgi:hypothetical protein